MAAKEMDRQVGKREDFYLTVLADKAECMQIMKQWMPEE